MDNPHPRTEAISARAILDPTRMPGHVAIIMDGNGRWAAQRGLPRAAGHRAGVDAVRRTVSACRDLGIGVLTLYAFSTENWRRPADEVGALMRLLGETVADEADELLRGGVRVRTSGDLESLEPSLRTAVEGIVAQTADNRALVLNIAYNYGGRAEIAAAAQRIAADVAAGRIATRAIDEGLVGRYLYTAGLPDPDLLIRTGGEQRISNFLLWQIAYAELHFCDVYWPDFDATHLHDAVAEYQRRRRRFGGVEDA